MRLLRTAILGCVVTLLAYTPELFAQDGVANPTTIVGAAQLALPTITTINPASGARGSSISVTLTGTDFEAGMTVNAGDGVAVSDIAVTSSTSLTATFSIATTASLGQHNLSVTTGGGISAAKPFTVVPPPPIFTGITPAAGSLGGDLTVTLSGTNFVGGLTLNAGSDITVRRLSVFNSSTATATLSIAPNAAAGPRDVTVTTTGGTSEALPFTLLLPPPPTLAGMSPAVGVQDSAVNVTLSGANFISGLSVDALDGITVSSVNVVSSTTATAIFSIAADATFGTRNVTVTTVGGTSGATGFSVVAVPPALTGISPTGGAQGAAVPVTLTGSNFATGMTIDAFPGITITNILVANAASATATFTIDATAILGARDVRVATASGTSGAIPFTVLPPPPTLSAISPPSEILGMAVMVTLTGTNFYTPMTIALGTDIAVSNITLIDTATATATFTIGLGASPGLQNVTITTPGGSSTAAVFSVVPFPPTLTGISPATVVQGTLGRSFPVTVTGTNLFDPAIAISGTGVKAPSNLYVTSGASGTAMFTVDGDAGVGPRDVTITTAGGTSAPFTFTVLPPTPTLTSIAPAIGVRGSSVNVTISGTNFTTGSTTLGGLPGITIGNLVVVNAITLTASFAIDVNAALGPRTVTATTGLGTTNAVTFTVADPFPDIAITSSHVGKFGVGFNETYTVAVTNTGTRSTSGTITVSDTLPPGLTFVSGIGNGWSCSAVGQNITCTSSTVLAAGTAAGYTLTVAVGTNAGTAVNHTVSATSTGDLNPVNNSATDPTTVSPPPSPGFAFSPFPLVAGEQATVAVKIPSTFPHDVTGTVTLNFIPNAVIPVDDPALQFATGGRTVTFTIPANSTQARFGAATDPAPLGFQTGTVAGRLILSGTFTAGGIQGSFSPPIGANAPTIAQQAPLIKSIETTTQSGFAASILLYSTVREVTELNLTFNTSPRIKLSCGGAAGCSVNANTITFDVASVFAAWFASDTSYGSLSLLRLPLSIDGGKVTGTVNVTLTNRQGTSNAVSFSLPSATPFAK